MKLLLLNLFFASFAFAQRSDCDRPTPVIGTASNAANVICQQAHANIPRYGPVDWLSMCGLGAREGYRATGQNLRESWDGLVNQIRGAVDWQRRNYLLSVALAANPVATIAMLTTMGSIPGVNGTAARPQTPTVQNLQRSADVLRQIMSFIVSSIDGLAGNAGRIGGAMACMPWEWRARYICMAFQQIATGAFIELLLAEATAARRLAMIADAFANFQRTSRMIPELRAMSTAQRLNAATEALAATGQYRTFMRFGDANVLVRNDAISGQPRYFLEQFATVNGRRVRELQEVVRDVRTGAFDANFPSGAQFARMAARNSDRQFMVFADVMDLGRTNYFREGTAAGDRYLQRVGEIMRNNMREGDLMFKNGGDELAVILRSNDPQAVIDFQRRVHQAMDRDPVLQQMFRENRVQRAQSIPRGTRPTPEQVAELQQASRTRPGLAMGAARIHSSAGESAWATTLARAEAQAAEVKAAAKAARGADTSKYGQTVTTATRPRFNAPVEVRQPLE